MKKTAEKAADHRNHTTTNHFNQTNFKDTQNSSHLNFPTKFLPLTDIRISRPDLTETDEASSGNRFSISPHLAKIDSIWTESESHGQVLRFMTEDTKLDGRLIQIQGKKLVTFGSCSYLGLELDKRLINSSQESLLNFGTQFSSSSTYVSLGLYGTLQEKYRQIFGANVIIAPTTTLAHLSAIPTIVQESDAVILDQQVHSSVQLATQTLRSKARVIKTIPHNCMNTLEEQIIKLQKSCQNIWYFLDGVYSMYGDTAPFEELERLKVKYPSLYLYIDDAHGMSWTGFHGRGMALSRLKNLDRTVIVTSHAKSFGSAGGTIISTESKIIESIRKFGSTLIFSGPIQPAVLGASLASADIHLSDEIHLLQTILKDKIKFRNAMFRKYDIPIISDYGTPIAFIPVGHHASVGHLFNKLKNAGFYVNAALFPAVPQNRNGIRLTTTLHQTSSDIQNLIEAIAHYLPEVLSDTGRSLEAVKLKFKISNNI